MNGTQRFLPAPSTHKSRGKLDENNHVQIKAMTSCEAFGLHKEIQVMFVHTCNFILVCP
jgi:hypothetical protein